MKKIKNVDVIANGAGIVSSACVGFVVGTVINAALPSNMNLVGKIAVMIGSGAIGGYIGGKIGHDVTDDTKIILESINELIPEDQYTIE